MARPCTSSIFCCLYVLYYLLPSCILSFLTSYTICTFSRLCLFPLLFIFSYSSFRPFYSSLSAPDVPTYSTVRSRSCAGCLIKLERGAVCNIKRLTLTPCLKRSVMYYITHFSVFRRLLHLCFVVSEARASPRL
jgi:hypothetical protein